MMEDDGQSKKGGVGFVAVQQADVLHAFCIHHSSRLVHLLIRWQATLISHKLTLQSNSAFQKNETRAAGFELFTKARSFAPGQGDGLQGLAGI